MRKGACEKQRHKDPLLPAPRHLRGPVRIHSRSAPPESPGTLVPRRRLPALDGRRRCLFRVRCGQGASRALGSGPRGLVRRRGPHPS